MFTKLHITSWSRIFPDQASSAQNCVSIFSDPHSGKPSPYAEAAYWHNLRTLSQSLCLCPVLPELPIKLSFKIKRSKHLSLLISAWEDYSPTAKYHRPLKGNASLEGEKLMKKLILINMARASVARIFGTQVLKRGIS